MQLQLPPILFYFIGTVLVVFGALRAWHLGWKRRERPSEREVAGDDVRDAGSAARVPFIVPSLRGMERRHVMFGVLWMGMGLFLIISTFINSPR